MLGPVVIWWRKKFQKAKMDNSYIALLRGINVGGHKKFPKLEQLTMLEELGLKKPQVYIHTGNWVFESEKDEVELIPLITEAILEKYGWNVPIIVIEANQFQSIFDQCPFNVEKTALSYFTLLSEIPSAENLSTFKSFTFPEEEYFVTDRCVYFFSTISAARVKMNTNFMEKKLKVSATSRNYKTMLKLISLTTS